MGAVQRDENNGGEKWSKKPYFERISLEACSIGFEKSLSKKQEEEELRWRQGGRRTKSQPTRGDACLPKDHKEDRELKENPERYERGKVKAKKREKNQSRVLECEDEEE
jgi:hypothetical protein